MQGHLVLTSTARRGEAVLFQADAYTMTLPQPTLMEEGRNELDIFPLPNLTPQCPCSYTQNQIIIDFICLP